MTRDTGASPTATGLSQAEPEVSALRASIPSAGDWHYTQGEPPTDKLQWGSLIWALGRYGDVFGPLPMEMIDFEAWRGNMLHASHDLVAWAECKADWREAIPYQPRDPSVYGERATGNKCTCPPEAECNRGCDRFPHLIASAIEARRAATGTGAVADESATGEAGDAPVMPA